MLIFDVMNHITRTRHTVVMSPCKVRNAAGRFIYHRLCLLMQVKRLESQLVQAEAQAQAAEAARSALQQQLQELSQTLGDTRASSEQHVQVCPFCHHPFSNIPCIEAYLFDALPDPKLQGQRMRALAGSMGAQQLAIGHSF